MKKVLFTVLILLLFLAGCGSQTLYMCRDGTPGGGQVPEEGKTLDFVCPDGFETENVNVCTFVKEITISSKTAQTNSINFVNGYIRSGGWSATLINAYPEEEDFYAQIVISKIDEQPYETLVKIDGSKGIASCIQNCVYTSQIE